MSTPRMIETVSSATIFRGQRERETSDIAEPTAPGLREVLGIWGGLGVLSLAVLITYSRFPVSEFYNVSIEGFAGGLSRTLVLLNFPVAMIGIALMGFAVARLYAIRDALSNSNRWIVGIIAVVAAAMSAATAFVVKQSDLDAKPGNAIPAIGMLLALGLTIYAVQKTGTGGTQSWRVSDTLRVVIIAVMFILSLHWFLADFGVFVGDIPLIGRFYMSKEVPPGHTLAAVHLGHHHGFDGVIFAVSAIILTRQLGRLSGAIRWPLTVYVALMLVYGMANGLQDFWGEQIVKRGWAETEIPSVAAPGLTTGWALILLGTAIVAAILLAMNRPGDQRRIQPAVS